MFHLLLGDGNIDYLAHVGHIMERQTFQVLFFDFFDVLFIVCTKDNFFDPRPFGRQDFLFDAAHRQHLTTKCDFHRSWPSSFSLCVA